MMLRRWVVVSGVLAMLAGSNAAVAEPPEETERSRARQPRIVNGLFTSDFPTTGALLFNDVDWEPISEDTAGHWCTGTLIGCQTFLTAAHCVEDEPGAEYYWVFLQHGGIFTVESIATHPNYDPDALTSDVAVLKLGEPVLGITPQPLPETNPTDLLSSNGSWPGTIAGFGRSGGAREDYGLKRYGAVHVQFCSIEAGLDFENPELLCWVFEEPIGAPGEDSNTCNGDSGGPLFMNLAGTEVVAGITSSGTLDDCLAGDESIDMNVYAFRSFIDEQLGSDSTTACGSLPAVGSSSVNVVANDGSLDASNPSATHGFDIAAGADALRFGLNSLNDGFFDADLYVKRGGTASSSNYDCKSDGASSYGFCEFDSPGAGAWSVRVEGWGSEGQYQLTTSLFGTVPEPGSGLGGVVTLSLLGLQGRWVRRRSEPRLGD